MTWIKRYEEIAARVKAGDTSELPTLKTNERIIVGALLIETTARMGTKAMQACINSFKAAKIVGESQRMVKVMKAIIPRITEAEAMGVIAGARGITSLERLVGIREGRIEKRDRAQVRIEERTRRNRHRGIDKIEAMPTAEKQVWAALRSALLNLSGLPSINDVAEIANRHKETKTIVAENIERALANLMELKALIKEPKSNGRSGHEPP